MKINDALNRIDAGWVRKPKGFRVHFNIYTDGQWDTDYSPEESAAPLDSDVAAWRLAWKLAHASRPESPRFSDGDLVNIFVVDDQGSRIRSYITNDYETYHPLEMTPVAKTGNRWKNEK